MKRAILFGLVLMLLLVMIPAAASAEPLPSATCAKIHIVKRGETLTIIARKYGVTVAKLANVNGIKNRNRIYVGTRLCIPGYAPPPPPRPPPPHPYPPPPPPPYYPPPPGPIVTPPGCSIAPVHGFGKVWYNNASVRAKLGCPTAVEGGIAANDEPFYSGYVIEDLNNRALYVLYSNGWWESQPDTWNPGDPVNNPYLVAPPGYYQPEYGIGKMWREVDNVSQRLGWARIPQRSVSATRQTYDRGLMLWTAPQGIYVLYNDGTWQHFN